MEWLDIASVGFVVVLLGTLFLFGELLVRAKGLFGLLGVAIMSFYFSHHLTGDAGFWVVILYLVGLALIMVDGKVISDGTIALLGIALMIVGLAIPSPSVIYGILVGMGFLVGGFSSALFLKVFPSRNMWSKMTLRDRLTGDQGYNSMNEEYKSLIGKRGKTITPFRPTGSVEIEGKPYSATSGSHWLQENEQVEVVSVSGTYILVKKIEEQDIEDK
ncbi:NfeD family protein [Halalkalibacterium halodurans]|uniref:NfeD family protein n=2 Tax=Halalkalibacterium halodurans TaxID=86665 RepID=UPI002E23FEA5|nr:NfeD family protein [Halalkalibacterium halodurans]MED4081765.1 NfeD family protein [Halalkalibacterium halodurans]MED4087065.1 NfeD family protein [Halalkalibacterium halodurans]MED4103884.1 NfeD family protein [Halalkalibacterium halodurans]MED4110860.1 NfeD family protein [Halalkalibacterium halodurans]